MDIYWDPLLVVTREITLGKWHPVKGALFLAVKLKCVTPAVPGERY